MAALLHSCLQHPDARLAPVAPSLDRGTVGSPCPFPRAFRDWAGALQLLVVSLEQDRGYARGLECSFVQELGQARAGWRREGGA